MKTHRAGYRAYLLRLWRCREGFRRVWRASLEEALTHEVQVFRDVDELLSFLKTLLSETET